MTQTTPQDLAAQIEALAVPWQSIETAPEGKEIIVYRHDGNAPWSYGVLALASWHVNGFGETEWFDSTGEPITTPVLWAAAPNRPAQPEGWKP